MPKPVDVLFNASTSKADLIQAWQQMPADELYRVWVSMIFDPTGYYETRNEWQEAKLKEQADRTREVLEYIHEHSELFPSLSHIQLEVFESMGSIHTTLKASECLILLALTQVTGVGRIQVINRETPPSRPSNTESAASDGTAISDSGEPITPLGPVVYL